MVSPSGHKSQSTREQTHNDLFSFLFYYEQCQSSGYTNLCPTGSGARMQGTRNQRGKRPRGPHASTPGRTKISRGRIDRTLRDIIRGQTDGSRVARAEWLTTTIDRSVRNDNTGSRQDQTHCSGEEGEGFDDAGCSCKGSSRITHAASAHSREALAARTRTTPTPRNGRSHRKDE